MEESSYLKGTEFYSGNDKNVFNIDNGDVYITLLVYTMTLNCTLMNGSNDNYYYACLPQ